MEFLPDCAPLVEAALLAGGFTRDARVTVMVRPVGATGTPPEPEAVLPPGTRLVVVEPDATEDVAAACAVAHVAFGEEGMPDQGDLDRLSALLRGGGAAVLVRSDDDDPLGSARFVAPAAGVAEVVGVAVEASWRGRGIAAAIVTAIVGLACRGPVELLWLSAADEAAGRVYERSGFRRVGNALHMSAVP